MQNTKNGAIDIFILNEKLFQEKDLELKELLVFHEICHFLEKSNMYKTLGIKLSEFDLAIGRIIQNIADDIADRQGYTYDPDHNMIFGAILNFFFDKYDP